LPPSDDVLKQPLRGCLKTSERGLEGGAANLRWET